MRKVRVEVGATDEKGAEPVNARPRLAVAVQLIDSPGGVDAGA